MFRTALISMSLICSATYAQTPVIYEDFKLVPSDGGAYEYFGRSVSISGNTAIVGAYCDNDNGIWSGSAYIYHFDGIGWIEEAKLVPSDGAAYDCFGFSVSISGDTAIVGARWDDDAGIDAGSAYIYELVGGVWEETKIIPSDGSGDCFGWSVSISGDTAIVGSPYGDAGVPNCGSAYIYKFDGIEWINTGLFASDRAANDCFGWSVSISGDTAIVGSPFDDDNKTNSGSAYIYQFNGKQWIEEPKLHASDGTSSDYFGQSVSISGDTAIVGAKYHDDNSKSSGSAYIYRSDGSAWFEEAELLAKDWASSDLFGFSVAIDNNTAIVGTCLHDDEGYNSGSAFIYRFDGSTWIEEAKLLASDVESSDWLGWSVSIYEDTVIVGAGGDDDNGAYSGSAYTFNVADTDGDGVPDSIDNCDLPNPDQADCNGNGIGDVCDLADGSSNDCQPNGVPDECEIANGTSEDCNNNGVPDKCDIADGTSPDFNDNNVPDECDPDCQPNGFPDFIDILVGTSLDCNDNDIPDECDIEDGTSEDCNNNGVPDECDIESGKSEDEDGNGIPDECKITDCNDNGIDDLIDIAEGTSEDCNGNDIPDECDIADGTSDDVCGDGIPDECQCLADINGDGEVDVQDLLSIVDAWGNDGGPEDINCDGIVDTSDLLIVIGAWGDCP